MKSEFAALSELAQSHGVSHTELVTQIHQAVLEEYKKQYPKAPINASVSLDTLTGDVHIYSDGKDITPPKFASTAASIARQTVINLIGSQSDSKPAPDNSRAYALKVPFTTGPFPKVLVNLFFWGYNLYFFLFNIFAGTSYLFSFFVGSFVSNLKEFGVLRLIISLILLATPAIAMGAAFLSRLYRRPRLLLKLFFLFELPLVVIGLISLLLLEQTTSFVSLIVILSLGLPFVLYHHDSQPSLSVKWQKIILFIQQFILMVASYLVFLFSFHVPPILGGLASSLFTGLFQPHYGPVYPVDRMIFTPPNFIESFMQLTMGLIILSLVIGLVSLPFLLLLVLSRSLSKTRHNLQTHLPPEHINTLQGIFAVVILTVCIFAAFQFPTGRITQTLSQYASSTTFSEKEAFASQLVAQKEQLKKAILDQATSGSRFFYRKDSKDIYYSYTSVFDLNPYLAQTIQDFYLILAYPFVYQGETNSNNQLSTAYNDLFGESVYKSDVSVSPVLAQNVLLSSRKITTTPHSSGLLATITVEEEYENMTNQQQEVLYEFTLPGAVMTDLKLGPDLEFTGIIAPKGAAQRTYEAQLQVRRDPALLEETGPRQYRLRVFPVPAKSDLTTLKGRRQKVQYTYVVAATPEGYPLPKNTRSLNIFSNASTRNLVTTNGQTQIIKAFDNFIPFLAETKPDLCQGSSANPTIGTTSLIALANYSDLKAISCGSIDETLKKISQYRIAVFIDVSSPSVNSESVKSLMDLLSQNPSLMQNNNIDVYKFNNLLGDKVTLSESNIKDLSNLTYFGSKSGLTSLNNFSERYDLVMIFPNGHENFEQNQSLPFSTPTTVYMIYPTNPPAYPMELASKLIQTGGDAVSTPQEALKLFALSRIVPTTLGRDGLALNQYLAISSSVSLSGELVNPLNSTDPLSSLINKGLYRLSLARISSEVTGNLTLLDSLNEYAETAHIVTPYSSLIALVNDFQLQQLEQFKNSYNRYEDQPVTTTQPTGPRIFRNPITPQSGLFNSVVGQDMMALDLEGTGRSSGEFGVITSPLAKGSLPSVNIFGGLGLFMLANVLLLGFGFGFYLLKIVRNKTK